MTHATNPLLDFTDHPLFDAIRPEHIAPALDQLLPAADAALEKVTAADFPPSGLRLPACWMWPPSNSAVHGVP